MSNPVATMRLDDALKPFQEATAAGFTEIGKTLREFQLILQMLQADSKYLVEKQKKSFIYRNADSQGAPYEVRYEGHKYMDVMAWRTDDITKNVTANLHFMVLGDSPPATPLTIISVYNMLLAGVPPWVPLNFPELSKIELIAPGVANTQSLLLVRYGMESWGMR